VGRHPSGKKRWKLLGEKHDFIPLLNHKTWENWAKTNNSPYLIQFWIQFCRND
jgi:hypothetical protein